MKGILLTEFLELVENKFGVSGVNDILDVSKIEAGKLSIERIPFSLKKVVQTTQNIFLAKSQEKGIYLKTSIDPDLESTHIGDPFRISQVLINLVGNSIKFTETGGVKIAVMVGDKTQFSQHVTIRITDTGVGMSEEFQQTLFEKFQQEDGSTARMYGATGLGLNITKDLLSLMGGKMEFQSVKNKGTVFSASLVLPIGEHSEENELLDKVAVWSKHDHALVGEKKPHKIDLTRLMRIAHGDQKFVQRMLQLFVDDVPKQLAELRRELAINNYKKVGAIAHRIKPSVKDLGIVPQEIQALEDVAKAGNNPEEIVRLTTICCSAIEDAIAQIRAEHL